ncbi:MAG: response regulator [Proteobacteria bacterium]|nr:response regulator [Pseudomonadota bacterium]MBU1714791.1 response regulator [Pseudomonadota bacterium]
MERKILVVDDEVVIREMLNKAFTKMGYKVVLAASAEEALEILQPDTQVMFLDLKLPGMDGIELCRRIRQIHPVACIFAITGYASLFELSDCREAGFDDYFTKPVKLEMLFIAAQTAFEKIERWKKK